MPSHGSISTEPAQLIDSALEHRAKREKQLIDALNDTPVAIDALTAQLYRGTPDSLMRFARSQVLAGLLKLQQEGLAEKASEETWRIRGG